MTPADLAGRLKLSRHTHSWRGDCPSCGYARTFSLRAGKNQRPLLFCANGCDRDALVDTVARIAGGSWRVPQRDGTAAAAAAAARGRKAEAALRMWAGSMPAAGTLADAYLTGRHLAGLAVSPALRFRADARHPEGGRLPALVAAVHDATGAMVGIHRTYLDPVNAGKALVGRPKPRLARCGEAPSASIRASLRSWPLAKASRARRRLAGCSGCRPGRRFRPATWPVVSPCRRRSAASPSPPTRTKRASARPGKLRDAGGKRAAGCGSPRLTIQQPTSTT